MKSLGLRANGSSMGYETEQLGYFMASFGNFYG